MISIDSRPPAVAFTESRALDGPATVLIVQAGSAGPDLLALRAAASPRLVAALDGLSADSPPLDIALPEGLAPARLVIWPTDKLDAGEGARRALGGRIAGFLRHPDPASVKIVIDHADAADAWACDIAYGAVLRSYAFPGYHTTPQRKPAYPAAFSVAVRDAGAADTQFAMLKERAASVHLARNLLAEPPNLLTPKTFADRIAALDAPGLEIEVLDREAIEALGMGALLAVGRGSAKPPYVVVMRWRGAADPDAAPIALVGKGVTFDSGGLNIKPAAFMLRMKIDMGGAAAVVGCMRAMAARKAPLNAVGIVGLVENMPSGDSYHPGDVLTTMSGQTVEVVDTDNEGRLVLCDLLHYAGRDFSPTAIVNIATLTGGARMALGAVYTPLFSNHDELSRQLIAAGEIEGELLWRMPTGPQFDHMFASPIADMTNGRTDIQAHSIVAARFLERFVGTTPWAHLDIGATWITDMDLDTVPSGLTGHGTALLDRFVDGWRG